MSSLTILDAQHERLYLLHVNVRQYKKDSTSFIALKAATQRIATHDYSSFISQFPLTALRPCQPNELRASWA